MVRLRMKRVGRRNQPYYRICAFDSRTRRDGNPLEELGYYHPLEVDERKQVSLKRDRIIYWLEEGAQPTLIVSQVLRRNGIHPGVGKRKSSPSPKAGE